jgi:NADPH:quinone reductase-like Zn-dependent oxidoreductase
LGGAVFDGNGGSLSLSSLPNFSSQHHTLQLPPARLSPLPFQVKSAALNPSNYKIVPAQIPFLRHLKQFVLGYDFAGVVTSVGDDPTCHDVRVGDEVFGISMLGSVAQYAVTDCKVVMGKPKSLTMAQASGLPVAALTSLEAFDRAGLKPGQKALVIGASGGCGIFGVTLAKAMGAHVTGVCSTRNVEFVRDTLGADSVVDYKSPDDMAALQVPAETEGTDGTEGHDRRKKGRRPGRKEIWKGRGGRRGEGGAK